MTKDQIVYRARKICTFCQSQIPVPGEKIIELEIYRKIETIKGFIYYEASVRTEVNNYYRVVVANAVSASKEVRATYKRLESLFVECGLKEIFCTVDREEPERLSVSQGNLIIFNVHVEQW